MTTGPHASCACCGGAADGTPVELSNRPGLSSIAYRVGTYARFRTSMITGLSGESRPSLGLLGTREPDDPAIAILDAWAVAADVLTFYTERIANEHYIGTATERRSIADQAALLGYRVGPGVSASAWLAITAESAPGTTAGSSIPAGTRVQTIPGADEVPQSFETDEPVDIHPEWNRPVVSTLAPRTPSAVATSITLVGSATGVRKGDRLLLVAADKWPTQKLWRVVRVATVVPDGPTQTTSVSFRAEAQAGAPFAEGTHVDVFVLRATASLFGHNAPNPMLFDSTIRTGLIGPNNTEWPFPALNKETNKPYTLVALDGVYDGVQPEGWAMLQISPGASVLARVAGVTEVTKAAFALSARVTQLQLVDESAAMAGFGGAGTRSTIIAFDSQPLTLAPEPIVEPLWGTRIPLVESVPGSLKPHRVLVRGIAARVRIESPEADGALPEGVVLGKEIEGTAVTIEAVAGSSDLRLRLRIDTGAEVLLRTPPGRVHHLAPLVDDAVIGEVVMVAASVGTSVGDLELVAPLRRAYSRLAPIQLFGNIVGSTHGESVAPEVIGSGDAAVPFQSFPLRKGPLTFVPAKTPSGGQPTLEVRVSDIRWREVASLFGAGPRDRVYTTAVDDSGGVTVTFGDGVTGSRLPTGIDNVVARYRTGTGVAGMARAEQIALPVAKPLGLKAALNPLAATGAEDPQTAADARTNAPLSVLTLGRVVSLQDYADFARDYSGVAKAAATWTWDGRRRGVHVTVAATGGARVAPDSRLLDDVRDALRAVSDARSVLEVRDFRPVPFTLVAHLRIMPDHDADRVRGAVIARLLDRYAFAVREFGQSVSLSEIAAVLHSVDGVEAARLDRLHRAAKPPGLEASLTAQSPVTGGAPGTLGAEILTLAREDVEIGVTWP